MKEKVPERRSSALRLHYTAAHDAPLSLQLRFTEVPEMRKFATRFPAYRNHPPSTFLFIARFIFLRQSLDSSPD